MLKINRCFRRSFGLVAGALLVFAVSAFAVTPKAGKYTSGGEGGNGFAVTTGGKSIKKGATAASNFKCNQVNLRVRKTIAISRGRFSFKGKVKTTLKGAKGTLTWKGHWVSATKVKGTSRLVRGSCNSGIVKWTASILALPPSLSTAGSRPGPPR
jgi:hypothetical protein